LLGELTFSESSAISSEANAKGQPLIALVVGEMSIGGAEIVNLTLAKEFLSRGFRVDIVAAGDAVQSQLPIPPQVRAIILGTNRAREVPLPFARYLRSQRPHAVIASMWPLTTICVLAHRFVRSQSRIAVCEHSTLSVQYADRGLVHRLMLKESIARTYPLAHARVAVSGGVADDLASLSGIARERFTVVHNPMTLPSGIEAGSSAAEAAWGGWTGPRILTVGRLKPVKNHKLLIGAFKQLLDIQDARLMIVGTGELAESTAAFARSQGLAEKVLMPGETLDPTPYYRSADLFVSSSDREGFGNVIIEALACGLPVVSTNCRSGPAEILEDGRYGRLVPVRDANALAQAMIESLSARHDKAALMRRAADFAPELVAEQYLKLLFPARAPTSALTKER
jgi:glycosyltransferase involved in cell wall biosynthesis